MNPPSHMEARTGHSGFYFDDFEGESAWIREEACLQLPPLQGPQNLVIRGLAKTMPGLGLGERGFPSLVLGAAGSEARTVRPEAEGPWEIQLSIGVRAAAEGAEIRFILEGVGAANSLAWLGRTTGLAPLQRFRRQGRNRQLRVQRVETMTGELVCDFSIRGSTLAPGFMNTAAKPGLNVIGWFDAELGLGESARCMMRAAKAADLPAEPIQLLVPCRAAAGNTEFTPSTTGKAPQRTNVFHIDPPASGEIDRRHGESLRTGKRNIGYWAWELGEFPDSWVRAFEPFDEIWCPSDFVREAVAMKSPVPVITMPHAISVKQPAGDGRTHFKLPKERFLFLFSYDLHSYNSRKNPQAVLKAFELAGFGEAEAGLVIKVHNTQGHEAELATLREQAAKLAGVSLITHTLPRYEQELLLASCDAFVSLHRAEGFGLAVAEAMALGKAVIATDWSATAEYLNAGNGCPVRYSLRRLERNEGPYPKGAYWAEPDSAHAAQCMRRLVSEPGLAAALGQRASETIKERFAPAVIGARYQRRLAAIAQFA